MKNLVAIRLANTKKIVEDNFDGNWSSFAVKIGKSPQYISDIKNQRRLIFTEKLARIIEEKLNFPQGYLDHDVAELDRSPDLAGIPIYSLKLSAGAGCSIINEEIIDQFWVSKKEIDKYGWRLADLCIFMVKGDSMLGRVDEGQRVLVNRAEQDIIDGKIYAFCVRDEVFIKYLFRNLVDGGIIARSHNTAVHHDVIYNYDDITIIDRVRILLAVEV